MPKFGKRSLDRLNTCHPDIIKVMNEVIKRIDITVLFGHRTKEEQFELFRQGRDLIGGAWTITDKKKVVTNLDGKIKLSQHNYTPSRAIDIAPYPIDFKDLKRFDEMGEIVLEEAEKLGVKLTWGKNFKKLVDRPHFQIELN